MSFITHCSVMLILSSIHFVRSGSFWLIKNANKNSKDDNVDVYLIIPQLELTGMISRCSRAEHQLVVWQCSSTWRLSDFLIIVDRYCLLVKVFFLWQNSSPSSDESELFKPIFILRFHTLTSANPCITPRKLRLFVELKRKKVVRKQKKNLQH